jgi:hypothetical protein
MVIIELHSKSIERIIVDLTVFESNFVACGHQVVLYRGCRAEVVLSVVDIDFHLFVLGIKVRVKEGAHQTHIINEEIRRGSNILG